MDPASPLIRIGGCTYKRLTGELIRDGVPVPLGRRALKVLQVLLDAGGELVSGEDILQRVWDGTIVEHNSVQAQVSALRRAMGKDRGLLRTYSGRGYRLMTDAQSALTASHDRGPRSSVAATPGLPDARTPNNLPSSPSSLIGRERSLEELTPLLRGHRLVTITGAGGIGKTRLILEAAARSLDAFQGGIYLVDLAPITDPQLVPATVISNVGIDAGFHASLADRARSFGSRPTLIVLDNCEHLIDAATRAAEVMVRANAFVHVVATSREPLKADGEIVYRVSTLDVPGSGATSFEALEACGASRLFIERALIGREHIVDGAELIDAIGRICRGLDGIPLAIELAAARANSLGILEVASRLNQSLDMLRGGNRTALARHQTLRATLEWSHELLAPIERVVLRRLAIFVGGFVVEAACRVAAYEGLTDIQALGILADLVDKSLISIEVGDARARYRFLETTRAFALERLQRAGEADLVARRHAVFRLEVLDRIEMQTQTPRHLSEIAAFRLELDNVRAALDWAFSATGDVALGFALSSRAVPAMLDLLLIEECASRAAYALAHFDGGPKSTVADEVPELRLRTALASSLVYRDGPTTEAMQTWNQLLARSRALKNEAFELRALWGLWTACTFAGLPGNALRFAESFHVAALQNGSADSVVLASRILGISHHYRGDQARSRSELESMINRYVHGAHGITMGGLLNHRTAASATLARVLWFQGFPDQAIAMAEATVAEVVAQDHALATCYVLIECALPLALLVGNIASAMAYLEQLKVTSRRQGLRVLEVTGEFYRTLLEGRDADRTDVAASLSKTLDRLRTMAFDCYSADLSNRLAILLGDLGRFDEAVTVVDSTLVRIRAAGERLWEPELLRTRGELLIGAGASANHADAEACMRQGLELARVQGALSLELRATMTLARLLGRSGKTVEGRRLLGRVCKRFTEGDATHDLVEAHALLAAMT